MEKSFTFTHNKVKYPLHTNPGVQAPPLLLQCIYSFNALSHEPRNENFIDIDI